MTFNETGLIRLQRRNLTEMLHFCHGRRHDVTNSHKSVNTRVVIIVVLTYYPLCNSEVICYSGLIDFELERELLFWYNSSIRFC